MSEQDWEPAVAGRWTVKGVHADGSTYSGSLMTYENPPRSGLYEAIWDIGTARYLGVGVVSEMTLSLAFGPSDTTMRVMAYTMPRNSDGNTMNGKWVTYADGVTKNGTETATRDSG